MKIRIVFGVSVGTFGFFFTAVGVLLIIEHYINFNLFFKILFLSSGIMITGALINSFKRILKLLIGFSVTFVVIIVMISTLLPIFLSFSENNTIQLIIKMMFKIIYWTILGAYSIRLIKISFEDTDSPITEEITIPSN